MVYSSLYLHPGSYGQDLFWEVAMRRESQWGGIHEVPTPRRRLGFSETLEARHYLTIKANAQDNRLLSKANCN